MYIKLFVVCWSFKGTYKCICSYLQSFSRWLIFKLVSLVCLKTWMYFKLPVSNHFNHNLTLNYSIYTNQSGIECSLGCCLIKKNKGNDHYTQWFWKKVKVHNKLPQILLYIYRIFDAIRDKRQEKPKIIRALRQVSKRKLLIGKYSSGRIKLLSS